MRVRVSSDREGKRACVVRDEKWRENGETRRVKREGHLSPLIKYK